MNSLRSLRLAIFWVAWLIAWPVIAVQPVLVMPIEGAIGPATADFVHRGLERAARDGVQLVVLRLDTPGGLDTSMREIIKAIVAAPIPVAGLVAPGGARAASAGTFILYACHIAAMAPATNLGAASPVAIGATPPKGDAGKAAPDAGDAMLRKATHDAAAYIRGLAQMRGRNADWAELAVREAVSLPAAEALKLKVIDLIADDVESLLRQIDGRQFGERTLNTAGAAIVAHEPDWRARALSVITNPSVAYLLILLGIYAIIFEFSNPGLVLPGVVGSICVLVAMYAFHLLPLNFAGVALIALGIGFMVAEVFVPAHGSLGVGGVIAFATGSLILIDTDVPEFAIPVALIGGLSAASALFLVLIVGMLARTRRRPVVSGREQLIGAAGEAMEDFADEGWARVHGERWRVHTAVPLRAGERLHVTAIHGLRLEVAPEPVTPPRR